MKFIAAKKIPDLLGLLARDARVWAPLVPEDSADTLLFLPWEPGAEVDLERFTQVSPKKLVMPGSEPLFSFSYSMAVDCERLEIGDARGVPGAGGASDADGAGEAPGAATVLFGARACDARSLTVLDALFGLEPGEAYNDPLYRARRAALTVVTLACTSCDAACFCSSWAEGPASTEGSDLILYPVEGGYLARGVSDRGEALLVLDIWEESEQPLPELAETDRVPFGTLNTKLLEIFSDMDFWERATERCVSCGYCTYACPTCYCFNIFDEMRGSRDGERCRSWDACMFYLYTLETSGHNPRPTIAHRYRNRIGHKFSYYPENQGTTLCTGCGRCIRGCPVGLDIRDVLRGAGER